VSFEGDLSPRLIAAVDHLNEAKELEKASGDAVEKVRRLLRNFLTENDFAIHACLMHANGTMDVCGAERVETPLWLEKIRSMVLDVVENYPRRQLNRLLFEDQDGTLVVTCYPEDQSALLVVAKLGATLGAVSIGVDRLARRIGHVKRM